MKKTWLTAVSIAGVLGTGSAAVMAGAVMNAGSSAATAAPVPQANGSSVAPRTVVYAVGDAARVTLASAGGVLTVVSTEVDTGWSVVSTSNAGPTVTVQLSDATRVVTFTATASGDGVKASVTAALVTPSTDAAPASTPKLIEQTVPAPVVAPLVHGDDTDAPAPLPAQPGARASHDDEPTTAEQLQPVAGSQPVKSPPPAATTVPSGAGATYGDDYSGSDDHESNSTGSAEHDDD